jgi:hypothetical protein
MGLKDVATLIGSRGTTPDPRMFLKEINKVAARVRFPLGVLTVLLNLTTDA